ncbi:Uncharacterised protein [uncultured archaeon]|nr:Uncharacterised protein [uncultured archaeon]
MLTSKGLRVNGATIALDDAGSEICFVSHAHSDHTAAFSKKREIIASEETFHIMGREPQAHGIAGVKLHPAGHMLGARQIFAETNGGSFAYTGDFALHDSYTAEGAKILQCDTLMIDSTYCNPQMVLPKRNDVLREMERFVASNHGSIIVFGAYQTGKTQELVKFLNKECKVAPVVAGHAAKVCAAYEKCGVRLDYLQGGSREADEEMRSSFVAIMPPSMVNFSFGAKLSEALGREVKTAVATGWAKCTRFPTDTAFALSDHADFRETLQYIQGSGARRVICANSNSNSAARHLRRLGIVAATKEEAAGEAVQTRLAAGL